MTRLSTLAEPLKALMKGVQRLQASYVLKDSAFAYSVRCPEDMCKRHLGYLLSSELVATVADIHRERDVLRCEERVTASLYAFNEAELAVLLTRAFEAGRRA